MGSDRLSTQMTNTRVLWVGEGGGGGGGREGSGAAHMFCNVPTQSTSMRPKGLSVTFDPNLSYQCIPPDKHNTTYWSKNTEASNRSTNFTSSHSNPMNLDTSIQMQCHLGLYRILWPKPAWICPPFGWSTCQYRIQGVSGSTQGSIRIFSSKPAHTYPSTGPSAL